MVMSIFMVYRLIVLSYILDNYVNRNVSGRNLGFPLWEGEILTGYDVHRQFWFPVSLAEMLHCYTYLVL